MLDPRLAPTPLAPPDTRRVSIRPLAHGAGRWRSFRWFIGWMVTLVGEWSRDEMTGDRAGGHVRALVEHVGGLWIKAAQLASLRIDVFGAAFCAELGRLQDVGTGFPGDVASAMIEGELGAPLATLFESFDREPLAAASIGQVHRARLQDGRDVAVKVQRPGVARTMQRQLRRLERIAWAADRLGILPQMSWRESIWELREVVREELDYRYEAANARRMRRTLARHDIYVPRVVDTHSTARVLTTEFVGGVPMADLLHATMNDPERARQWLDENGIDPAQVALELSLSLLRQVLEDNVFHGDLHPGNILLLRGGRVALIDFGTVSSTDRDYLEKFRLTTGALATRELEKAAELTLLMCGALPHIDVQVVVDDLARVIQAWTARTFVRTLPFHQKSLNNIYGELTRVLVTHGCALEWAFLRIRRAQETLDASLLVLLPEGNSTRIAEQYFDRAARRAARAARGRRLAERIAALAAASPDVLDRLTETGEFQLELVRRQAQVFVTEARRVTEIGRALTRLAAVAAAGVVILVIWPTTAPGELGNTVAALDIQVRSLVAVAAIVVAGSSFRVARRLALPDTTVADVHLRL